MSEDERGVRRGAKRHMKENWGDEEEFHIALLKSTVITITIRKRLTKQNPNCFFFFVSLMRHLSQTRQSSTLLCFQVFLFFIFYFSSGSQRTIRQTLITKMCWASEIAHLHLKKKKHSQLIALKIYLVHLCKNQIKYLWSET